MGSERKRKYTELRKREGGEREEESSKSNSVHERLKDCVCVRVSE